jgi:hypothetical protein
MFDNEFYDQTMQEYFDLTLSQQTGNVEIDSFINQPLKMEELEGAIFKLKRESSPGPDSFSLELFIHAGEPLVSALLMFMNISWENGILPIQWRQASVKFLKKMNK